MKCPKCGINLNIFSGNEMMPEGFYCPECNDVIYDEDGKVLCDLF